MHCLVLSGCILVIAIILYYQSGTQTWLQMLGVCLSPSLPCIEYWLVPCVVSSPATGYSQQALTSTTAADSSTMYATTSFNEPFARCSISRASHWCLHEWWDFWKYPSLWNAQIAIATSASINFSRYYISIILYPVQSVIYVGIDTHCFSGQNNGGMAGATTSCKRKNISQPERRRRNWRKRRVEIPLVRALASWFLVSIGGRGIQ